MNELKMPSSTVWIEVFICKGKTISFQL